MVLNGVSIVTTTWNERANIQKLIPTIRNTLQQVPHEIIVVDDNSSDGTFQTARLLADVAVTKTREGQTNVLKDIRMLEPLVSEVLPLPKKLHDSVRRLRTLEEAEAAFPGFKSFLDATEQEIPRPKNKLKRKTRYSGKKKKHTVKTQITVNKDGLIVHKARHAKGSTHTYALFKQHHPHLPDNLSLGLDLGYAGVKTDYPKLKSEVPFKRKRPGRGKRGVKSRGLSPEQKMFNKKLAKDRVVVEHTFSRLKKFRVMTEEFRNRLKHYDTMTDIVSGLINFRIMGTTTA